MSAHLGGGQPGDGRLEVGRLEDGRLDLSRLDLRVARYDSAVVQQLVAAVQQEYVVRYGGPDETPLDPDDFAPPRGTFLVGWAGGIPVATGGWRLRPGGADAELKRMFVVASHRGHGYARQVLAALEDAARQAGARRVVLETGERQPEAVALYESAGYARVEPFGHYADAPLARHYGKEL